MIQNDTKASILSFIKDNPEGVTLNEIATKAPRDISRAKLRTLLDNWYFKSIISRVRMKTIPKNTYYLPFDGNIPIKKERKITDYNTSKRMLNAKDFRNGRQYAPFLQC